MQVVRTFANNRYRRKADTFFPDTSGIHTRASSCIHWREGKMVFEAFKKWQKMGQGCGKISIV